MVEFGVGKKVIEFEELEIGMTVTLIAGDMEVQKRVVFAVRVEEGFVVVAVVLLFVVLDVVKSVIGIEGVGFCVLLALVVEKGLEVVRADVVIPRSQSGIPSCPSVGSIRSLA